MAKLSDAEKLAAAVAFVVNGYTIGLSTNFEDRWLLIKYENGNTIYWGSYGGWITAKLLSPSNDAHQRNVTHTLDDAFEMAKELPEHKGPHHG